MALYFYFFFEFTHLYSLFMLFKISFLKNNVC